MAEATAPSSSGDRCATTGDLISEPTTASHTRPAAPRDFASFTSASRSLRDHEAAPGAANPFTTPPLATAPAKALNPLPLNLSVRVASSMPYRVSGLSLPNRRRDS